jgi:hypothetical protein
MDYGCKILYNPAVRNDITVSSVLSHEVIELFIDPFVDLWADGPQISAGSEYSFEACDPVEADIYQITPNSTVGTVSVSNFVYPEYFNESTSTGTKLDYLSKLTRPYTMSDYGYMIVRSAPGQETAIFGAKYPAVLKAIKS